MRAPASFDPALLPEITSPQTDLIFSDYIAAHAEIENVGKDREVKVPLKDKHNPGQFKGHYTFVYATMAGILHHIRPALTSHGIWFVQFIRAGEMVTRIIHKSGQWIEAGHLPMPDVKGSPQDLGSIVSYVKRYSLSMAFGLASEEDNDGEQGDREVSFRARGTPKAQAEQERKQVDEPPMGWGDWTRGMIDTVKGRTDLRELEELQRNNWGLIAAVKDHDQAMYKSLSDAFAAKRSALNPNEPI